MSSRKIVVCVGSEAQARRVSGIACEMARRSHAHLLGVNTACHPVMPGGSMYMMPANPAEALEFETAYDPESPAQAPSRNIADQLGECEWESVDDSSADAARKLVHLARHADLVIMAQSDPAADPPAQISLLHDFAAQSQCPVLIVPAGSDGDTAGHPALANLGVLPDS